MRHNGVINGDAQCAQRGVRHDDLLTGSGCSRAVAVAAAVGVPTGEPGARAAALVQAGVDVLVLDTAHVIKSKWFRRCARWRSPARRAIVAGNVVTAEAAVELAEAGADILKVGVRPGAMCTTRMMTRSGARSSRPCSETAEAVRDHGAHVWADGGVRYPRECRTRACGGGGLGRHGHKK